MAEGLLTTEQTTPTKLCALQENEAMDTPWLLKTERVVYAALQTLRCLKSEFNRNHLNNFTQGFI